jgi:FixJ family two-component response regulator
MSKGGQPLVLVVDDDASIRRSLTRLFRTVMGLDVATFASGQEFLAYERPAVPTCLVLDVHLPDMTGLELLRLLARMGSPLPVVVITAASEERLPAGAFAAETIVLRKPFDQDQLLAAVCRLLGLPPP